MSAAEWIAQRRELLDAATEGPWEAATGALVGDDEDEATHIWHRTYSADRAWMTVGKVLDNDLDQTTIEDAEWIADARTSLPRALDALDDALGLAKGHRDFVTKRGRDDCICTICDMCRAIENALRADS